MSRRKPLAGLVAITAALAIASPAATASADSVLTAQTAAITGPISDWLYATCPPWYGFKNPAIGCSSWADYFRYAVLGGYGR
jgi:hypothetical protein